MTRRTLEARLYMVARAAEETSNLMEGLEEKDGDKMFEGATWLKKNARLASAAPALLAALKSIMEDYNENYQTLTDGQYGRTPGGEAWKRALATIREAENRYARITPKR